jgi:desulfoferrodoxin (superoxide reductase-like protein)
MINISYIKYFVCLLVLVAATGVLCHEPTDMDVKYSAISGNLTITIYHKVNSTSIHYINLIEIYLNRKGIEMQDKLIISQKFFSQPIRNEQRAHYLIKDLNPGDVIKINAYCNLFGQIEKTLQISDENWQEDTEY